VRWLQWATADLQNGLGGVEVHARSLARELSCIGMNPQLSSDPKFLTQSWDVFQTHGSAISFFGTPTPKGAIRIHTLHGTTLGRMAACGEWTWPGGYLAALREFFGVLRADIVLSIHSDLWLYRLARRLGKTCAVCSNGWDSAVQEEALPEALQIFIQKKIPFWVFIGRGGDRVKATHRIEKILKADSRFHLVAAPGDGLIASSQVIHSGLLSPGQIRVLLKNARGLILTSLYEGLPLVVLEALAQGTPVLSTRVGGLKLLSPEILGLSLLDFSSPSGDPSLSEWLLAISHLQALPSDPSSRAERAKWNRPLLASWKSVAEVAAGTVRNKKH
jgi:glycosyltransferase involved in cell wall biosynthesis